MHVEEINIFKVTMNKYVANKLNIYKLGFGICYCLLRIVYANSKRKLP